MPYEDDCLLGEQDNVAQAKSSNYGGCKLKLLHKKTLPWYKIQLWDLSFS